MKITSLFKTGLIVIVAFTLVSCITTMDKEAIKVDPDKALASHIQLGLGYLAESNLDSARFHINKAAEMDSDNPGMLNARALLYQMEGEPQLAEKSFKKALSEDRKFTQARLNYATFLYGAKRYKEAYENYEIASDDLNYKRRAVALYGVGISAKEIGKHERAIAAWKHSVLLQSNLAPSLIELADYYFQQGDYALTKQYLTQHDQVTRSTARSLWLGIRIERIFGNKDKESSQVLSLKNLFPYSQEYLEYKQGQASR